jgi:hypothetical protein
VVESCAAFRYKNLQARDRDAFVTRRIAAAARSERQTNEQKRKDQEFASRNMSPEWIPLLFAAAVIVLLLLVLRPRAQSRRVTICRIVVMEAIYLGMAYLLLDVLEHPPAEALVGSIMVAALAGAIPNRYYRKLAREE